MFVFLIKIKLPGFMEFFVIEIILNIKITIEENSYLTDVERS